jgi:nitrate reductase gamma subunit
MMDDCQDEAIWSSQGEKDQHKRQRPLLVGSFLLGLGLCCLFFVYPAMMIADMEAEEKAADRMSETKANHLLALICIMAAFASPLLAFRLKNFSATDISTYHILELNVSTHLL